MLISINQVKIVSNCFNFTFPYLRTMVMYLEKIKI